MDRHWKDRFWVLLEDDHVTRRRGRSTSPVPRCKWPEDDQRIMRPTVRTSEPSLRILFLSIVVLEIYWLCWSSSGVSSFYNANIDASQKSSRGIDTDLRITAQERPPLDSLFLKNRPNARSITQKLARVDPWTNRSFGTMSKERFNCALKNGTKVDVPVFPHFIIAGTQKGGTTAVSQLLTTVPGLLTSKAFEPHFWSYGLQHTTKWSLLPDRCAAILKYLRCFNDKEMVPGVLVYEKTPVLMAMPYAAETIRNVLDPHLPKIIVILRDPVDRFYSEYKMQADVKHRRNITVPPLTTLINDELREYHAQGFLTGFSLLSNDTSTIVPPGEAVPPISPHRDQVQALHLDLYKKFLARGFYANQLKAYMEYFPLGTHLKVVHYETFIEDKVTTLNEILEFVGAEPFVWNQSLLDTNLGPLKKRFDPAIFQPESMTNATRAYLKALYAPFNDELANMLGEEWQGVWNTE